MAKFQLLVAGLCATSALASPWARNQKRDGWGSSSKSHGGPWGYGSTTTPSAATTSASETSPWGYGSSSTCEASTVTETCTETQKGSTLTIPASTVTLSGEGSTHTVYSTITESAPIGPITPCASTVTTTNYITRSAQGYNVTDTVTSVKSYPGTTVTVYQ